MGVFKNVFETDGEIAKELCMRAHSLDIKLTKCIVKCYAGCKASSYVGNKATFLCAGFPGWNFFTGDFRKGCFVRKRKIYAMLSRSSFITDHCHDDVKSFEIHLQELSVSE